MLKPKFILTYIVCLFVIFSCNTQGSTEISTYTVLYKNFENTLRLEGVVEPVFSTNIVCPRGIDGIVTYLIEDGSYVDIGDTICIIEDTDAQNRYDEWLINLENAETNLTKVKADLEMQYALLEAQVKSNEAETLIAQLDSLQLQYSSPIQRKIKELELETVAIQREKLQKKLEALEIIQQSEIRKMELEIQRMKNQVQSMKEIIDALIVLSPKKGLAIRAERFFPGNKLKVNDNVWGNNAIVSIPELHTMKVKITASETEYKYISMNDSVVFTFDAMPGNLAWGKIIQKAPVGRPLKEGSKVKIFDLEASIDSILTMPDPGFTVNCNIYLKIVRDTLVVPQLAVFEEDSIKVVYVQNKKGYDMRQVETGLSSLRETIITAGLKKDEIISLTKPSSSHIKGRTLLIKEVQETSTESPTDSIPATINEL